MIAVKFVTTLAIFQFALNVASAQNPVDPFDGQASRYRADLSRYFVTPDQELEKRQILLNRIKLFSASPANLPQYEQLLIALNRHYAYFRLKAYDNNLDSLARAAKQTIAAAIDDLQSKMAKVTGQQKSTHQLSVQEEAVISNLGSTMIERLTGRYDREMDQLAAPDLKLPDGRLLNPVSDRRTLMRHPDPAVRKMVSIAYHAALDKSAGKLALTLIDITHQHQAIAKLRGYRSAPESVYARRLQLPEDSVRQMFRKMAGQADVLKDYQRLLVKQVKKKTGLENVHSYDLYLLNDFVWTPLSFFETRKLTIAALEPLGAYYQKLFGWLLDPRNGALDIASGPNRVNENTAVAYPGVPTTLYMRSYKGTLSDVLRLIHEGGHGIHGQLMSDRKIPTANASGPGFLNETYAMLNELLLLDELEKHAKTPAAEIYYTQQFLTLLTREIFASAEEGAFEQGLYDGVANGTIKERKDIDSLYVGTMKPYDLFFDAEPERKSEWMDKRLVFDDPLYNVNYLYAILVTCQLYQQAHDAPKKFALNYRSLLENGFPAPADVLLKKNMGINNDIQTMLSSTLDLFKSKKLKLEKLYHDTSFK